MPKIIFIGLDKTIESEPGISILEAAMDNDIALDHACGGACACATCHVIVREGFDTLSEMEEEEEDRLDMAVALTDKSRLSCQAKLGDADITIKIP